MTIRYDSPHSVSPSHALQKFAVKHSLSVPLPSPQEENRLAALTRPSDEKPSIGQNRRVSSLSWLVPGCRNCCQMHAQPSSTPPLRVIVVSKQRIPWLALESFISFYTTYISGNLEHPGWPLHWLSRLSGCYWKIGLQRLPKSSSHHRWLEVVKLAVDWFATALERNGIVQPKMTWWYWSRLTTADRVYQQDWSRGPLLARVVVLQASLLILPILKRRTNTC